MLKTRIEHQAERIAFNCKQEIGSHGLVRRDSLINECKNVHFPWFNFSEITNLKDDVIGVILIDVNQNKKTILMSDDK